MRFRNQSIKVVACGLGLLMGIAALTAQRAEATASSGACCRGTECATTDQFSCEQGGGTYFGDNVSCDNVQCDRRAAAPAMSLLGLVGITGILGGLGLHRLTREWRKS